MTFKLPELPYDKNALAPHMSAETFDYHYAKHHNAYVVKANELIAGTAFEGKSAEEIMLETAGKTDKAPIFNNVAQHWNHSFFWHCLSPNGGGTIPEKLKTRIASDFGSVEAFKESFVNMGIGQFGSGWVWLVENKSGKLEIVKTGNADTPLTQGLKPLLTCDVWEHAYYVDYRNQRPQFLKVFIDSLANWDFAIANLESADGFKL